MEKKVIFGGIAGAAVIIVFTLALTLVFDSFLTELISSTSNVLISLLVVLLAPIAGGFLAGLVGKSNPLQAGLLAGLIAGVFMFIAWLVIVGFSLETVLSGLVILFVWVVLARVASGFARLSNKS